MSDRVEAEANEIRDSEAYQDESHELHEDAKLRLSNLYNDEYGSESAVDHSKSLLHKRMEEALEELHGTRRKPDQEARLSEPVIEGGAKFGDPMKIDEAGNPVTIMDRPDLYKIEPDSFTTREEAVEAIETEEDFNDFMREIQPRWRPEDGAVLEGLIEFGEEAGIDSDNMKAVYTNFIQSPEYGKSKMAWMPCSSTVMEILFCRRTSLSGRKRLSRAWIAIPSG
jgi:hypothetical protein